METLKFNVFNFLKKLKKTTVPLVLLCLTFPYFMRILNSCSLARFDLANQGVRQPAQPHTFYARLLVFDKTSAQPHFAVVNCSDAVTSVLYSPVLTSSLIFLLL